MEALVRWWEEGQATHGPGEPDRKSPVVIRSGGEHKLGVEEMLVTSCEIRKLTLTEHVAQELQHGAVLTTMTSTVCRRKSTRPFHASQVDVIKKESVLLHISPGTCKEPLPRLLLQLYQLLLDSHLELHRCEQVADR